MTPPRWWMLRPKSSLQVWGGLFLPFLQELLGPKLLATSFGAMAPHLTEQELDKMATLQAGGKTLVQIAAWLSGKRSQKGMPSPNLTAVRRALKGQSQKGLAGDTWQKEEAHHETGAQVEPSQEHIAQKGSVRV